MLAASLFWSDTHQRCRTSVQTALRSKVHYYASSAAHQITSTQPLDSVHFRRSSISVQARTSGLFPNPSGHCLVSPIFEFRHFIGYNPPGLQLVLPSLCLPSSSRQFQRLAASVSHPPKSCPSCGSVVPNLIKFYGLFCKQSEQRLVTHILLSLENLPSCKQELPHCSFPIRSICLLRFCDTAIYNDGFQNSGNQHTRVATQQPHVTFARTPTGQ